MENFERIKEELKIEIERELHQIDPSIDLNGCLDLYNQVIKSWNQEAWNLLIALHSSYKRKRKFTFS